MREIWRPVLGYEDLYEASNLGRIKSLWYRGRVCKRRDKILSQSYHKNGYAKICLTNNCEHRYYRVHRVILEAFRGKCPKNKEAAHLDGNRKNNILSNLRWVRKKTNHKHKRLHGTAGIGEAHSQVKLTEVDVIRIRDIKASSKSYKFPATKLAKEYGVCVRTIHDIVERRRWTHV